MVTAWLRCFYFNTSCPFELQNQWLPAVIILISFKIFYVNSAKSFFQEKGWKGKRKIKATIQIRPVSGGQGGPEAATDPSCCRSESREGQNQVETSEPVIVVPVLLKLHLNIVFLKGLNYSNERLYFQNKPHNPYTHLGDTNGLLWKHDSPLGYFHHTKALHPFAATPLGPCSPNPWNPVISL